MNPDDLRRRYFDSISDAAQFLRLFDFLPTVYLYVKDREGRFVAVNETRARMRGATSAADLIGKTDLDIHPAFWARQYREEDRRVMRHGELPFQVWMVPAGDGRPAAFLSSKIPIRDRNGEVIGIAGVMYRIDRDGELSTADDPIARAVDRINGNYADPLTVADLATEIGLSVSQFHRNFRTRYRMSPSEYIQRVRVHQAARLLSRTRRSAADIAVDCGFYDQAHLTRTFRKWMRTTPSAFREEAAPAIDGGGETQR